MNVRARFVGLFWCIKYFPLRKAEAPTLLELSVFLLEHIFQWVVRCRWSSWLARLLESVTLRKADRNKWVSHGVCRLFLTYKTEKLWCVLNDIECVISYSRAKLVVLIKTSSWHQLCWVRLIYWPRIPLLEVCNTSSNLVIQFCICTPRNMTLQ